MVDLRRARVHLIDRIQDKLAQVIWLTAARHYSKRERVRKIPRDVAFVCLRSNADDARIAHMDLREKEQGRM